jgi:D-beta-D-heptose 7-phosphate kinase/D-beta-D-heptose 1-phosphate adenosyltransferase
MNKNHLVIGDLIFDKFIYGNANRISAEAPTLVLDVEKEIHVIGGAYNVAAHLSSLGHGCIFVSAAGHDFDKVLFGFQDKFDKNILRNIIPEDDRVTSVKTRLISEYKNTHLLRYDNETTKDISEETENLIISYVENKEHIDDILLIDYKKGVITKNVATKIIDIATKRNIPVYVDTKKDDLHIFKGCTVIKPNKFEFEKIRLRYAPDSNMEDACKIICDTLNIHQIVITAGSEGIYAYNNDDKLTRSAAELVEVKELSGAGDSVLAVLSYCVSEGHTFVNSIKRANRLAAKFVSSGIQYRAKKEDLFT